MIEIKINYATNSEIKDVILLTKNYKFLQKLIIGQNVERPKVSKVASLKPLIFHILVKAYYWGLQSNLKECSRTFLKF